MKNPVVVLTRAQEDNVRMTPLFEGRGMEVRSIPMIEIRNLDIDAWEIPEGGSCLIMLTSSRATSRWLAMSDRFLNHDIHGYLVVGRSSSDMLAKAGGLYPVLLCQHSIHELFEQILHVRRTAEAGDINKLPIAQRALLKDSGVDTVIYPCNAKRREEGVEGLRKMGFRVIELQLYEPVPPLFRREEVLDVLRTQDRHVVLPFFSPSAVENFFEIIAGQSDMAGEAGVREVLASYGSDRLIFASIGETTAEALYSCGVENVVIAEEPKAELLVDAVLEELQSIS